jgi:D-threonate/D-erythronate kinase
VTARAHRGELAIIADDLSSCTDCGIQIGRHGFQTFVALDWRHDAESLARYDVVALDTDSRTLSAEAAYRSVAKAAAVVRRTFTSYFKSLDSTLRGNLGAEVDAVMDTIEFDFAVVAPAFPHYGRTTVAGIHFLDGTRIDETEFASDPVSPVRESDLVKLFKAQSRRAVGHVALKTVRQGKAAVSQRVARLRSDGVELVIFDAQAEADLDSIVLNVAPIGGRVLWVGSTGLAGHISTILNKGSEGQARGPGVEGSGAPNLAVVGSASQVTRGQVATLLEQTGVRSVRVDSRRVVEGEQARGLELERCLTEATAALCSGSDVVLEVASTRTDIATTQALGQLRGLDGSQVAATIVECLAELTHGIVESTAVGGLMLTGGATARAVCDRLGARGILIVSEVEPGIPLARLVGAHEMAIVTKAGGFGEDGVLVRANQILRGDR